MRQINEKTTSYIVLSAMCKVHRVSFTDRHMDRQTGSRFRKARHSLCTLSLVALPSGLAIIPQRYTYAYIYVYIFLDRSYDPDRVIHRIECSFITASAHTLNRIQSGQLPNCRHLINNTQLVDAWTLPVHLSRAQRMPSKSRSHGFASTFPSS